MKGNIMLRHVSNDFHALIMANAMELAGMTVISVTPYRDELLVFARYQDVSQIGEADKIYEQELDKK